MNARAIKRNGDYRLYRVDGHLELWLGTLKDGVLVTADIWSVEDFDAAVADTEEELAYLLAHL